MISVLLPWVLGAAVAGSAVVFVWHLLSVRQPPELLLPTARFVPGADARAVARRPRPNDLLLMLLRIVAVLAIGAAFSGLRCASGGAQYARLVYVDRQHTMDGLPAEVGALDSASVTDVAGDTLGRWQRLDLQVDPGAALARVWSDAASLLKANSSIEQVELSVVLPASVQSRRGWDAWRGQWPGPVRVVARDSAVPDAERTVVLRGARPDDVVSAALAVHMPHDALRPESVSPSGRSRTLVTIARSDSVRMPGDYAGVWVHWSDGAGPVRDTIAAVSAAGRTVLGPFVRRGSALPSAGVHHVAWWSDGEPAATSREQGAACLVDVQVDVPAGSDLLLSPEAGGLIDAIVNACAPRGIAGSSLAEGPRAPTLQSRAVAVSAESLRARVTVPPPRTDMRWTWAFLVLAGVAMLLEWRVRQ